MIKKTLFILIFFSSNFAFAQTTLEECWEQARRNYPLIKRQGLIEKANHYNISNANRGYLPKISFTGKASYQSEVTEFPAELPGVKSLSKDQYLMSVDIDQPVWDGGRIQARKKNLDANTQVEESQLEVDLYQVTGRVNDLFFGILLLDAQLTQNDLYTEDLDRTYQMISAQIENGIASEADLDVVKLEQVQAVQDRIGLLSLREAYLVMLETLTGMKIQNGLVKPDYRMPVNLEINRPELMLYEARNALYDSQKNIISAANRPQFSLFATGAYGKPGLDIMETDAHAYFIGGARISWNFESFYTSNNEKKILHINQRSLWAERETFLLNTNLELTQQLSDIDKLQKVMAYDEEVIKLRQNIRKSAQAKVTGGTLTVTEYMREVTGENQAYQSRLLHEIELLNAVYSLKNILNR